MSYIADSRAIDTLAVTNWTVVGGAQAHLVLRDSDAASYLESTTTTRNFEGNMEDWSFPSDARIEAVRGYILVGTGSPGNPEINLYAKESGGTEAQLVGFTGLNPFMWYIDAWKTTKPSGGEWTYAVMQALHIRLFSTAATSGLLTRIYEAGMHALVHSKPRIIFSSPTPNQLIDYHRPKFTWQFQADGDGQNKYRPKIYTAVEAEGGGFDPATTAVTVTGGNPGVLNGSNDNWQQSVDLLPNTYYYFYLQASSLFPAPGGPTDFNSSWTGVKFKTASKPVVTIPTPTTGGNITTTQPTYIWTYTDNDGKPLWKTQVATWKMPGGGWAGFDPDTTVLSPIYNWYVYPGTQYHPPNILENGANYRTYVKGLTDPSVFPNIDSGWVYTEYTVAVTAPPTPTLIVSPSNTSKLVGLTLTSFINELSENASSVEIDTSDIAVSSGTTLARVNTVAAAHGSWEASGTKTGSTGTMIISPGGLGGRAAVVGSVGYSARCSVRAATTGRSVSMVIYWMSDYYPNGPTVISTSVSSTITDSTGAWQELTINNAIAPLNAVSMQIQIEFLSVPVGEVHYIDKAHFGPGTLANNVWNLGGRTIKRTQPGGVYTEEGALSASIERSDNNGGDWTPIRGFPIRWDERTQNGIFADREMPFNTLLQYRAVITSSLPGAEVSSAYALAVNIGPITSNVTWLKDPYNPALNAHFRVQEKWLSRSRDRQRVFYKGLGRKKPIAFRGESDAEQFSVSFYCDSQDEFDQLEAILLAPNPLLYATPRKQWYVELAGPYTVNHALWDELHRTPITHIVQCTFVEVDYPTDV